MKCLSTYIPPNMLNINNNNSSMGGPPASNWDVMSECHSCQFSECHTTSATAVSSSRRKAGKRRLSGVVPAERGWMDGIIPSDMVSNF